jgi:molecular chaperone GrpE
MDEDVSKNNTDKSRKETEESQKIDSKKQNSPVLEEGPKVDTEKVEEISLPEEEKIVNIDRSRLEELEKKAKLSDEYLQLSKRLKADFENYKKRIEKERSEFLKYANEELIKDILPILDNLKRALASVEASHSNSESFIEGVRLIKKMFEDFLSEKGVRQIESLGTVFDPRLHEAVMQREDDKHPEGMIVEVVKEGYYLNEKVIVPAQVVVAKKPCASQDSLADSEN